MARRFGSLVALVAVSLLLPAAAQAQTSLPYNSGTFAVSASTDWTDTGLDVSAGDEFFIVARGAAVGSPIVPGLFQQFLGPDGQAGNCGDPYRPLPSAAFLALIGRVGTGGEPFFVGETGYFRSNTSGRLFLGINDGYPGDNQGGHTAFVHLQSPCPGFPSPLAALMMSDAPAIDGVVGETEWSSAGNHGLVVTNGSGAQANVIVHLGTHGGYLFVAVETPFTNGWDVYCTVAFDGNHSGLPDGSASEPHRDVGYNKACPSGYPGYDYYNYILNCTHDGVPLPAGAASASSGNPASYEYQIPLTDLTASPGGLVGFAMWIGTVGTPQGNYGFPHFNPLEVSGSWQDVFLATGSSAVQDQARNVVRLSQAPNPFQRETRISYETETGGRVDLRVFDASGRLVKTLVADDAAAGNHEVVWTGRDEAGASVPSGVYLLQAVTPDGVEKRKVVISR